MDKQRDAPVTTFRSGKAENPERDKLIKNLAILIELLQVPVSLPGANAIMGGKAKAAWLAVHQQLRFGWVNAKQTEEDLRKILG